MQISFFTEDSNFPSRIKKRKIQSICKQIIESECSKSISYINFIACSDERLKDVNIEFLQHDYYTDIITFDYNTELVESDIFLSIDRINENAKSLNISQIDEFYRICIHGVLHLSGYEDSTQELRSVMTLKENEYLEKLKSL